VDLARRAVIAGGVAAWHQRALKGETGEAPGQLLELYGNYLTLLARMQISRRNGVGRGSPFAVRW
jgi:hypothetical protein